MTSCDGAGVSLIAVRYRQVRAVRRAFAWQRIDGQEQIGEPPVPHQLVDASGGEVTDLKRV